VCIALGNEGIHNLQRVFWNLVVTGNHDYWHSWPEALYFGGNLMPIHLGHVVVDDHGSKRADRRNLQAVSSGGGSEHRISTSFEQRSLVTQNTVIIVDAQNCLGCWVIGHNFGVHIKMIDDVSRPKLVNVAHFSQQLLYRLMFGGGVSTIPLDLFG